MKVKTSYLLPGAVILALLVTAAVKCQESENVSQQLQQKFATITKLSEQIHALSKQVDNKIKNIRYSNRRQKKNIRKKRTAAPLADQNQETDKEFELRLCTSLIQSGNIGVILSDYSSCVSNHEDLNSLIKGAYQRNATNTENILKFIDGMTSWNDILASYATLLEEIEGEKHFDTKEALMFAFKIKGALNDTKLPKDLKPNFLKLKDRFPVAVHTIIWGVACLKVLFFSEYLVASSDDDRYSPEYRNVYTLPYKSGTELWVFEPISNGSLFLIKNWFHNEYLYSPGNWQNATHDFEGRYTFTAKSVVNATEWSVVPVMEGKGISIRNPVRDEYLYAAKDKTSVKVQCTVGNLERRFVLGWRSLSADVSGDPKFQFVVEEC